MANIWMKQAQQAPEEPKIEQPEDTEELVEEEQEQAPEEQRWGW